MGRTISFATTHSLVLSAGLVGCGGDVVGVLGLVDIIHACCVSDQEKPAKHAHAPLTSCELARQQLMPSASSTKLALQVHCPLALLTEFRPHEEMEVPVLMPAGQQVSGENACHLVATQNIHL